MAAPLPIEDINLIANLLERPECLWSRNHPSIYVWMLGSDKLPHPDLENKYIGLFEKYDPSRIYVTSAGGAGTEDNNIIAEVPLVSEISGPDRYENVRTLRVHSAGLLVYRYRFGWRLRF
ncbi:MAG: hypothetical protein U5K79_08350 [Cyclobacteriaceae bacterium]|nr:hypothetical protein [Cyclobacteriaceae bacterium]